MKSSAISIIAATFGLDRTEVVENAYQPTKSPGVFTLGDEYFCVGKSPKVVDGIKWEQYKDQFFANRSNTILWVGSAEDDIQS